MIIAVFTVIFVNEAYAAETPLYMKRIDMAADLVNKMALQADAAGMADTIRSAKGVAVFPDVAKAGFIIGAEEGQGIVLLRTENGGWSGPAFMGVSGASVGFQVGAESIGLVLVINNDNGLHAFTGGNSFKLGADVAVAAGPVGRQFGAAQGLPLQLFDDGGALCGDICQRLRHQSEQGPQPRLLGKADDRSTGARGAGDRLADTASGECAERPDGER